MRTLVLNESIINIVA